MAEPPWAKRALESLGFVAIVVVTGAALHLRLVDPLSSRVIGAEDPFTHIVFTREYLENGFFGRSFHMGTDMYPPGLHILAGTFWTLSGVSPYEFTRFFPAFLGAFSVLGVYVVARRHAGVVGGLVGATATAVMPEHIFRTNLLFPTALDLAFLPAFYFLVLEAAEGRHRYLAPLGVLGLAMAVAHPWVIPLAGGPALAFLGVRWLTREGSLVENARRLGPAAGVLLGLMGFAATTRWDQSGSGFGDFLRSARESGEFTTIVQGAVAAGAVALVALFFAGALVRNGAARPWRARMACLGLAGVAGGILALVIPHFGMEPQQFVDYQRQMGWPLLSLALAGFVVAAGTLSPLGLLAAAFAAVTYPLTAINVFQSDYLPHRTVVYMAMGATLLAAVAAGRLASTVAAVVRSRKGTTGWRALPPTAAALVVLGAVAGPVVATTPPPYEWYRYYDEDEFVAFEEMARILEAYPDASVVSGQWQPNLMMKALTPDLDRAYYSREFFRSSGERQAFISEHPGEVLHVIVDDYTRKKAPERGLDLSFLEHGEYERLPCECGSVTLYRLNGGGWG